MRAAVTAMIAILALVLGAAGGYFWQNRALTAAAAKNDGLSQELTTLKTRVATLETEAKSLTAENGTLATELEAVTADYQALLAAVQVTTSPKDLAVAYARARIGRNQTWIKALMTPELAAAYQFPPELPDMVPTRYAIVKEPKATEPSIYVVRVWESYQQGEVGYTDATLEIAKVGDFYKIKALSFADHVRLQQGK